MKQSFNLSIGSVARHDEFQCGRVLAEIRWPDTGGEPVCPRCEGTDYYRLKGRKVWRCARCKHQFSITSGTVFAGSKVSTKDLLLAACHFISGASGVSSLASSRVRGAAYKTSFLLFHKFREAIQRPELTLSGEVQIDGCTIGGYRIASNLVLNGTVRRIYSKRFENRRIVTVAREVTGRTKCFVANSEYGSISRLVASLDPETVIHADGASCWNSLSKKFRLKRVEHTVGYSYDGACTNMAESFFSQLRLMTRGVHRQISAKYLELYANELAWRQDHRKLTEDEKIRTLLRLCVVGRPSEQWKGYFQRRAATAARRKPVRSPAGAVLLAQGAI